MKTILKYYDLPDSLEGNYFVSAIDEKPSDIQYPCKLFADQATKTGIAIFDNRGYLITTVYATREDSETTQDFKHHLIKLLKDLVHEYKIDKIFHEEVYGGKNFETLVVLLSIREAFQDTAYQEDIAVTPLNNMKWKSVLASPNQWVRTIDDKKQIKFFVRQTYPMLDEPQDVLDAIGMGIAVLQRNHNKKSPLAVKINKRFKVHSEVWLVKDVEEIFYRLRTSSFTKKIAKGAKTEYFDYQENLDLETNSRYLLTDRDVIAITLIPQHRNLGQVFLKYGIRPSMVDDDTVIVGVASRGV